MVPMRDGIRLYTEVWKPSGSMENTRSPVVFTRGYSPGRPADAERFNNAGYVYVGQSTRGHGKSEGPAGEARRFFDDAADGYDALTWIAGQPWCDGQIAMYGKSYWGITQWLVAPLRHPNLRAIVPQVCTPRPWIRGYWCHGALSLAMAASGRAYDKKSPQEKKRIEQIGWWNYFMHLPLVTLDEVLGRENKLWRDYITHSSYDHYWQAFDIPDNELRKTNAAVYQMGGWYDHYPGPAFEAFRKLQHCPLPDNRIVMNPSDHLNRIYSDRDFGPEAEKDEITLIIRWLDALFRGKDNRVLREPPVKIFVMGRNQWRHEKEWPPARAQPTPFYLHGAGVRGRLLSTERPREETPDTYASDPDSPVPSLGGNHSFYFTDIPQVLRSGAVDQRPIESRPDVLVFSSDPLQEAVEVTGPVEAIIYAASSAPDTDFIVRLIDVHPDGTAYNLTEGILRARFREDLWGEPRLIEPGKVYQYRIDMMVTSNVFLKKHRIRIHVASSSFPQWDRNPNTGHPQGLDTNRQIAHQTVFHDRRYPSRVVLPIIPSESKLS